MPETIPRKKKFEQRADKRPVFGRIFSGVQGLFADLVPFRVWRKSF
jgi:hypothetical protein